MWQACQGPTVHPDCSHMWVLGGVGLVVPSTTILSINPPIACIEEPDYEWQMKEKRLLQVRDLFSPSHLFLKKKIQCQTKAGPLSLIAGG